MISKVYMYSYHFRFWSEWEERMIDVWKTITTSCANGIEACAEALATHFWWGISEASVNDVIEWEGACI